MPIKRKKYRTSGGRCASSPPSRVSILDVPESRQRAIFTALGEVAAAGQSPEAARYAVAKKFVLTILKVEAIEQEGLTHGWQACEPPRVW
jgi:hypothetical protein